MVEPISKYCTVCTHSHLWHWWRRLPPVKECQACGQRHDGASHHPSDDGPLCPTCGMPWRGVSLAH
jgi:uncharacterized protein (DUF983 family)